MAAILVFFFDLLLYHTDINRNFTFGINFDSLVDNGEYYPHQILPSNIMSPAMNHPQGYAFIKLVKRERRW